MVTCNEQAIRAAAAHREQPATLARRTTHGRDWPQQLTAVAQPSIAPDVPPPIGARHHSQRGKDPVDCAREWSARFAAEVDGIQILVSINPIAIRGSSRRGRADSAQEKRREQMIRSRTGRVALLLMLAMTWMPAAAVAQR